MSYKLLIKKHVFVKNKRTMIAIFFFLENIGIWMFFRMLSIRFKYLNAIIKKQWKLFFQKVKNRYEKNYPKTT